MKGEGMSINDASGGGGGGGLGKRHRELEWRSSMEKLRDYVGSRCGVQVQRKEKPSKGSILGKPLKMSFPGYPDVKQNPSQEGESKGGNLCQKPDHRGKAFGKGFHRRKRVYRKERKGFRKVLVMSTFLN